MSHFWSDALDWTKIALPVLGLADLFTLTENGKAWKLIVQPHYYRWLSFLLILNALSRTLKIFGQRILLKITLLIPLAYLRWIAAHML
jgi:hypothetical protein